jgi:dolichol-phosphate mannosyltransferase
MDQHLYSKVSIVIPVLNERRNLEILLPKLRDYNLIIVDDRSDDGTAEFCLSQENVLFIERDRKMGLVSAILEGFKQSESRYSYLVTLDSDISHDPDKICAMLEFAIQTKKDMVIGSRYINGGSSEDTPFRKMLSYGANLLYRIAFSGKVKDATSGFRVYSRNLVDFLLNENKIDPISPSYAGQIDILNRSVKAGFSVAEYPIQFRKRKAGESKLRTSDIYSYLKLVASRGYLMRYVLVGISGVIINELLLKAFLGLIGNMSEIIAVETSVLSNFALNDRITFHSRNHGNGHYLFRMLKYNFFNLGGIGINILIFLTLISYRVTPLLANLVGIIAAFIFTYTMSIKVVWRR